jgi:hypothetical protein
VSTGNAIPDAPLSGTIGGQPFVVRDARYIVDKRVGYEHTDIVLSTGTAPASCAVVVPARATSVWLRLEGAAELETKELRIAKESPSAWSVHYQVFQDGQWHGVSDGSAVVSIVAPSVDGKVIGGLAVCFSDDKTSCVSGSFEATSCPQTIDQPVRGAVK